jgi:hypothetical protein
MTSKPSNEDRKSDRAHLILPGIVDEIIPAIKPANGYDRPEKAQIAVEGAEPHYAEIQVNNTFLDKVGNTVYLKLGAEVEVTIEASVEIDRPDNTANSNEPETSNSPDPLTAKNKSISQ